MKPMNMTIRQYFISELGKRSVHLQHLEKKIKQEVNGIYEELTSL